MRKEKPSKTAYKVCLNIITLGSKPGMDKVLPPGIVEASEKLLIASGAARPRIVKWARSQRAVSLYEAFDWMMPGQFEAFAHRKAFCEKHVIDTIGDGASQVLVLGAGYDTMGWQLAPKYPEVDFFEIDHPATSRLKTKGIEAMGERKNLHLIAEDLGERKLEDALKATAFWDKNAKTAIIAEGLLPYLAPDAVRDLFNQCILVTGTGSRIAFTYVPTGSDGRPDAGRWTGLVLWLLKIGGEPWLWSILPENLGRFLEETGWKHAPELVGSKNKHGVEFFDVAIKG
jgi:methyltransferase (TIGR00027 family)